MILTKKQLKILSSIVALHAPRVTELSNVTDTSLPYISETLKKLQKNDFIKTEKLGITKIVKIADTQHATLLRKILLDQPHLNLNIIANKRLPILKTINCLDLKTWEEIQEMSDTSFLTLERHMTYFKEIGLVQKKKKYIISPRFQTLREFLSAYQNYTNRKRAEYYASDAIVKWGCGESFIFETEKKLTILSTGISAFHNFGAQFLTIKNTYLHKKNKKQLTLEDHLLNHILSEKTSNILPLLITWKLNQNNIKLIELKIKAYQYRISEIINDIIDYFNSDGIIRSEYLPDYTEFIDRYREYSHD